MSFEVDYGQLSMAGELLSRQQRHATAIEQYVKTNCTIGHGDLGLLLQVLYPVNELVVTIAATAAHELGSLSAWGSRTAGSTLDSYVAADEEAYEEISQLLSSLGTKLPPFSDPRGTLPKLGSASSSAPSDYGDSPSSEDPIIDALVTAGHTASSGAGLVTDTVSTGIDRIKHIGAVGVVAERTDPSSYLVAPSAPSENFVEDLRWQAGVLLGSIDWLAEKLIGVSILKEYVMKPLGGDWQAIGTASDAWSISGRALLETGSNFTALPNQVDSWDGSASAAFQTAMTALGAASVGLSYAFDFVADYVTKVASIAKVACGGIASVLKWISDKLTRMAAEAAVPVIGWAMDAAEAIDGINELMKKLRMINELITSILDAISDVIEAKAKTVEVGYMIEDLLVNAGRRAVTS